MLSKDIITRINAEKQTLFTAYVDFANFILKRQQHLNEILALCPDSYSKQRAAADFFTEHRAESNRAVKKVAAEYEKFKTIFSVKSYKSVRFDHIFKVSSSKCEKQYFINAADPNNQQQVTELWSWIHHAYKEEIENGLNVAIILYAYIILNFNFLRTYNTKNGITYNFIELFNILNNINNQPVIDTITLYYGDTKSFSEAKGWKTTKKDDIKDLIKRYYDKNHNAPSIKELYDFYTSETPLNQLISEKSFRRNIDNHPEIKKVLRIKGQPEPTKEEPTQTPTKPEPLKLPNYSMDPMDFLGYDQPDDQPLPTYTSTPSTPHIPEEIKNKMQIDKDVRYDMFSDGLTWVGDGEAPEEYRPFLSEKKVK